MSSPSSSPVVPPSIETTFRKIQHETFEEYIALLKTKLDKSFVEAQTTYPWGLDFAAIEQERVANPVPSHHEIRNWCSEASTKYNAQLQDDMTINLSPLALFLKSATNTSLRESSTAEEQQEFTSTVTSLLMCAAVDTFRKVSGPYTPYSLVLFSRLLAMQENCEEANQLWLWSKVAATHLVTLEVQTWVSFALEKIIQHQQVILAFVDKIGNLGTKRRRNDEEQDDDEQRKTGKK